MTRRTLLRQMATFLAVVSVLCAGADVIVRTAALTICRPMPARTLCQPPKYPFAQQGTILLVCAGVGLLLALVWLLASFVGPHTRPDQPGVASSRQDVPE